MSAEKAFLNYRKVKLTGPVAFFDSNCLLYLSSTVPYWKRCGFQAICEHLKGIV